MSSDATKPLAPEALQLIRARTATMLRQLVSHELSNGARLHMLPAGEHGIAALEVWAKVGSGDEPKPLAGISHLLEHLMFRGTLAIPDGELDALVESLGVKANAWTWFDTTAYTSITPVEAIDTLLKLEADRFQNLQIDEDIFQTERDVVLNERALTADSDPTTLAQEHLDRMLFGDGPYAHPVIGDKPRIAAFTREQLIDWYQRHYAPSELDIFVVGDIDTARVLEQTRETFGAIAPAARPRAARPKHQHHNKGVAESITLPVAEPLVMMAWGLEPRANTRDAAIWKLMSEWLTFGRGGELRARLEYDAHLALEQQLYVNEHRLGHSALWEATPREGVTPRALADAFYDVMRELAETGPTPDALDAARVRLLTYHASATTPWRVVRHLGFALHNTDGAQSIIDELDAYFEVTADDLRQLARRLADPDESVLLLVHPE